MTGSHRTDLRQRPVILRTTAASLLQAEKVLSTEVFGPAGVIIEYSTDDEAFALAGQLRGCLTAAIHGNDTDPLARPLIRVLSGITGRIVWNAWPTGVSVTAEQHHGGPWPATTNALHTSVGLHAINRWLRPIAYQSLPTTLLPSP